MANLVGFDSAFAFSSFETPQLTYDTRVIKPTPKSNWRRLESQWLDGTAYYFDPIHQHIWGLCGFDKSTQFTKPEEKIFYDLVETNGLQIAPHVTQPVTYSG